MDIHQIARHRIQRTMPNDQKLRIGQIVQGKILKLYPNNKAQIQLGSQTMVAQLELALSIGEQYHFRVEQADEMIHLKVVGGRFKSESQKSVTELIQNLGLKASRSHINLVQDLINQKIPFDKNDLIKSFALLEKVTNKTEAQMILTEMIAQKRPITASVFQAMLAKHTTTLSEQMNNMILQLRQYENRTPLQQSLLTRLTQMSELPLTNKNQLTMQIMVEVVTNHQQTFEALKVAGVIGKEVDFSTWKNNWRTFFNHNQLVPPSINETLTITNHASVEIALTHLQNESQELMTRWTHLINEANEGNQSLREQTVNLLRQELNANITPLLSKVVQYLSLTSFAEEGVQQAITTQPRLHAQVQTVLQDWIQIMDETVIRHPLFKSQNFMPIKQQFIEQIIPLLTTNHFNISNQQLSGLETPYSLQVDVINQVMQHMNNVQSQLQTESQSIVQKWANVINQSVLHGKPFSDQDFSLLRQEITDEILSLLHENQQEQVRGQLQNQPIELRQLLTTMQSYSNEQTYLNIEHVLSTINKQDSFQHLPLQDQFLSQVKQMLLFSGITDENLLTSDLLDRQNAQSVKSMLIQMIQQGEPSNMDRGQQLIHFINGLQIDSVQEVGNFIQASLQVPGEKLALHSDLYLEFESKKTEDGKVNPDYCRILFYLDLEKLQETVVDMQVQKRFISVTVFNDHTQIKNQAIILQPLLKNKLKSIDYQLSNIMVKPLHEMNDTKKTSLKQSTLNSYEGIEYRI